MYEFNIDDLTLDEQIAFEDASGISLNDLVGALSTGDLPPARALKAIASVIVRRTNPDATDAEIGALSIERDFTFNVNDFENDPKALGEQNTQEG